MIQFLLLGVDRADIRDWAIILYCLVGFLAFFSILVLVSALVFVTFQLKGLVKELVNDSVKPTLASVKEAAASVKGTTDFVGETAVRPIIRTYGMVSGVKRGLGVLSGLTRGRKD